MFVRSLRMPGHNLRNFQPAKVRRGRRRDVKGLVCYCSFFVKGVKLEQAHSGQQFDRAVKDVELWLDEVETQLGMEEIGKVMALYCNLLYCQLIMIWMNMYMYCTCRKEIELAVGWTEWTIAHSILRNQT